MRHLLFSGAAALLISTSAPTFGRAATCEDPYFLPQKDVVIAPCARALANARLPRDRRMRFLEYRAGGLRAAKRYDDALRDVDAALALAPQNASAIALRARILYGKGDFEDAWSDVAHALDLAPGDIRIILLAAAFANSISQLGNVKELLDRAAKIDPENFGVIMGRFYLYRDQDDVPGAIAMLERAIKSPRDRERDGYIVDWHGREIKTTVALNLMMADLFVRRFDWKSAVKMADEEVERSANALTLTERAAVRRMLPSDEFPDAKSGALRDIDAAIVMDATFHRSHGIRGLILTYREDRYDDAIASFDEAIRLNSGEPSYFRLRANVFKRKKQYVHAEQDLKTYAMSDPNMLFSTVKRLRKQGYYLEDDLPNGMTQALSDGIKACARDPQC